MKPHPRPARPTSKLSDSLHHRLNMYALAASAAGVGILALTQPAEAKIVYTKAHRIIGPNSSYEFTLNHDGTTDFKIQNASGSNGDFGFGWVSVTGGWRAGSQHAAYALTRGKKIGPKLRFSGTFMATWVSSINGGPWDGVQNRYLGLKFEIKGKIHYGWARLNVTKPPYTATLTGYAYETIPDKAIIAGRTKGADVITAQPVTLGRLALGRK